MPKYQRTYLWTLAKFHPGGRWALPGDLRALDSLRVAAFLLLPIFYAAVLELKEALKF